MLQYENAKYIFIVIVYTGIRGFGMIFSLSIIPLDKFEFDYKNAILLVSFKKIRIYIILLVSLKKDKYSLLQYKSVKYLFSIPIILIKVS